MFLLFPSCYADTKGSRQAEVSAGGGGDLQGPTKKYVVHKVGVWGRQNTLLQGNVRKRVPVLCVCMMGPRTAEAEKKRKGS